jgi:hypothetical protein
LDREKGGWDKEVTYDPGISVLQSSQHGLIFEDRSLETPDQDAGRAQCGSLSEALWLYLQLDGSLLQLLHLLLQLLFDI